MKLVRHGERGAERPGLIDESVVIRDLSAVVPDIGGATLLPSQLKHLSRPKPLNWESGSLFPCCR